MSSRRRPIRRVLLFSLVVLAALVAVDLQLPGGEARAKHEPMHHIAGGFKNVSPEYSYTLVHRARRLLSHRPRPVGRLRAVGNDGNRLRDNREKPTVTWVGHSTFLIQLDGVNILTDPIWSDTPSPIALVGPNRLVPPGIRFEDLPPIDAVVVSHDHYDHLDEPTVRRLAREHRPRFFVPLGIGDWLRERGIDDVVELDWWGRRPFRGLVFVCTPAQHSSGRRVGDQNRRLWSSWVVQAEERAFFFAGDTGYYPGLKEIAKLGRLDLALIPIGGYGDGRRHHPNHVNPEEAVQLLADVGAARMIPMHWGTFDLNREPPDEPPSRVRAAAARLGIEDRITVLSPGQSLDW